MRTGSVFAGDSDQVELACFNDLLGQPIGFLAEDDRGAIDFVDALEARGEVHGVADHRVGPRRRRADGPYHGLAGGDAHADGEIGRIAPQAGDLGQAFAEFGDGGELIDRGLAAVRRVVVARRERCAPERHDRIADILVDDAVVAADFARDGGEIPVEQVHHRRRGELLADIAEASDVGEEDRHHLPLGRLGGAVAVADQARDDARVDELAEHLLDALAVAQLGDHAVEGARELADLVPCGDEGGDAGLSLFGDFPNLTLRLDDLSIAGKRLFAGDTLARIHRLDVVLDLGSVLRNYRGGDAIVVRSIELERPVIALKVLEDGSANWDITKKTATTPQTSSPFKVSLRKLDIRNATISLDDRKSRLFASLVGYRQSLSGDFTTDLFTISTQAHGDSVTVRFAGIPYLNRVALDLAADVNADMRDKSSQKFTLAKNELRLNDLRLALNGSAITRGDNVVLDLTFNTPRTDFRHILSLVPAIYMHDFQKVKTAGALTLFHGDKKVGEGRIKTQLGAFAIAGEGVRAGRDGGSPVTGDYPGERPWAFTGGTLRTVAVDVSGEPYVDLEREAAAMLARE